MCENRHVAAAKKKTSKHIELAHAHETVKEKMAHFADCLGSKQRPFALPQASIYKMYFTESFWSELEELHRHAELSYFSSLSEARHEEESLADSLTDSDTATDDPRTPLRNRHESQFQASHHLSSSSRCPVDPSLSSLVYPSATKRQLHLSTCPGAVAPSQNATTRNCTDMASHSRTAGPMKARCSSDCAICGSMSTCVSVKSTTADQIDSADTLRL